MSDGATPERSAMRLVPAAPSEEVEDAIFDAREDGIEAAQRERCRRNDEHEAAGRGRPAPEKAVFGDDWVVPVYRAVIDAAPHGGKVPLKTARDFAWALYEAAHDGLDDADLPALFRQHLGLEIAEEGA
jgi:hypothetical protein